MKKTISLILVLALGLVAEPAMADFTFGEPVNLGPTVNSGSHDWGPSLPADGLELYLESRRPDGEGSTDLWVTTRDTRGDEWGTPVNLGATVNTSNWEEDPSISADGLSLYFSSNRPGGSGNVDLWVTTRETVHDEWVSPVNLGPTVNSAFHDGGAAISSDGLDLYFVSNRPGGSGFFDLWVTTRATTDDDWGEPVNIGPPVNSSVGEWHPNISADGLLLFFQDDDFDMCLAQRKTTAEPFGPVVNLPPHINTSSIEGAPCISYDGSTLYFVSNRSGDLDLWQVSIEPVVDLNTDGIVDAVDMCIVVDNWGTDNSLCDIGPMPWGDGIVDVQDLIVLAEHLFEEFPPIEPVE